MKAMVVAMLLVLAPVDSGKEPEGAVSEASLAPQGAVMMCEARAENPSGDPASTCCCQTRGGGFCCAEMAYCGGGFVLGCACAR